MDLLEREPQLAALREYAEDVALGRPRLVLVSGEAGVGKSALVEAFRRRVPDARWLAGSCDGLFTPRPLAPLLDVAEQVGGELATLCRQQPPAAREQLFDALLRELRTAGPPSVLVLEDLHWADRATLDLVHFLSRRLDRARTLLLLTYRDDPADTAPDLARLLGELATHGSTRNVTVPPLTRAAVATVAARSALGTDDLYRLTGGNPFFLTEVLAVAAHQIPATARAAVLSRVAGLGPQARGVLDSLALLGRRVELDLMNEVVGAGSEALDELLSGGALRLDGDAVVFRHEIARRTVADAVPAHRAMTVHRRALGVLRKRGSADHARLAYHADGAGDSDGVLVHAPAAAATAVALGAHRQAVEQYERALRHAGAAGERVRATLLLHLVDELGVVDRWAEACDAGQEALSLFEALGDVVGTAGTLRRLSKAYWRLAQGSASRDAIRRSVELLRPLGPGPELAASLAALAGTHMFAGENDEAIRVARSARDLAAGLGLHDVLADADNSEACARANLGGEWLPLLTRSLEVARRHGLHSQAGRAFANLANMHQTELHLDAALAVAAEGSAYTEEHDVGTFARCLRGARVEALEQLGRWQEAVPQAEALLAEPASPENRIQVVLVLGRIRARQGDLGARQLLAEGLAGGTGAGDPQFLVPAELSLAEADWLVGDLDGARTHLHRALGRAAGVDPAVRGLLLTWARRLGVPAGDLGAVAPPYAVQLIDPGAAAARWVELGCPYSASLSLLDAGGEESLREALLRLDRLGATATATRVRQLMRDAGVRSVPSGARASTRANPHGLTAREQDVLDRIVEGLGNADIARELFITPKTVEHHVSHLLAKLGVADRREAAALVTARSAAAPQ